MASNTRRRACVWSLMRWPAPGLLTAKGIARAHAEAAFAADRQRRQCVSTSAPNRGVLGSAQSAGFDRANTFAIESASSKANSARPSITTTAVSPATSVGRGLSEPIVATRRAVEVGRGGGRSSGWLCCPDAPTSSRHRRQTGLHITTRRQRIDISFSSSALNSWAPPSLGFFRGSFFRRLSRLGGRAPPARQCSSWRSRVADQHSSLTR